MKGENPERPSVAATTAGGGTGTGRFRVAEAPGELKVVQDLLNTCAVQKNRDSLPDLLDAPDTAAHWLGEYGIGSDSPGVSKLQKLRDTIRQVLITRDRDPDLEHVQPPADIEVTASLRLEGDGTVRFAPGPSGISALVERVLVAMYDAQRIGTWRRLKVCRNPKCPVVFWDSSRNTSGVWHDVRTCGNAENLRKSRARRVASTA